MNLIEILSILLIHWFADFVLQTDEQAKGKSKEWKPLLHHTFNYSVVWFLAISCIAVIGNHFGGPSAKEIGWDWKIILFPLITFIAHTITDYFTSRLNSKLWSEGKVHDFFVSVGFDQWLHYAQLFITYWVLTN
jgi:hypothetical protein